MTTQLFDAEIIGSDQAGPSLANSLSKAGMKDSIFERGQPEVGVSTPAACLQRCLLRATQISVIE